MTDDYPDVRADERTTLEQFLDQYRRTVAGQIADLDSTMASARVLPATDLTVGGLVKHLAHTEDMWFTVRLADAHGSGSGSPASRTVNTCPRCGPGA